ncbi:MAG: tetratricopeptide repeat protein [Bacteroidales bacterium]|nr:tetratricopeptide repeat protein [Bacteroidales bacterium]
MIDIFKRWISHSKEQDIDDSQNPWAGLASYEDPETAERKLKFCGRDDDSYDLARLIIGNVFVTLYGKSGIGKTSLLNAGVFPELREEQYTPVSIRLGRRDEEQPQSYQTMIVEAVKRVVTRVETINVIGEQQDQQSLDYLWNYFARHRFYDKYDEPTTPVIVFDQFEEVFRGHRDEAGTLLRQLDYLNDKDHTLDICEVDGQSYRHEQNFRFVVSIREDDLYRLEDSIDNCYLPALKRCRYRLRSLSEEGAREVILIPGKGLFRDEEQDQIVNTIINIVRNKEDQSISTNLLSLICNRIFVEYQRRQDLDHINQALVDNFIKDNPFEHFYNEATHGFSNREKNYIEDHFVDSTGRRNSLPESDFLLHVKNGSRLLEGNARILQKISTSSDGSSNRIELIHDSFCEPLVHLREKRERRNRIKLIATIAAIFIILLGIIGSILYLYSRNQTHEVTIASQKKTIAIERDSLKKANNLLDTMKSAIRQKEEELLLKQQELEKINEEYGLKQFALAQKTEELYKYETMYEVDNENNINGADMNITYIYDGIKYPRYGIFKPSDLDNWKSLNEEVCRKKIPELLNDSLKTLDINDEMIESDPGLVYLILKSQSLSTIHDKQEWFNLWYIMNEEQVFKLYDILTRERYKMSVLQYRDKAAMLNNEAYRYARNGDFDTALNTIEKSIEMARIAYASKYDSKGEILLMKGDTQEAVKMWNKVLEIAPDFLGYYGSTPFYEQLRKRGLVGKNTR